jgi:hypothetical protein
MATERAGEGAETARRAANAVGVEVALFVHYRRQAHG